jgi:chloramphenicol-sensitive protein RarD
MGADELVADVPVAPGLAVDGTAARERVRAGVLYGVAAYGLWGVFPLYFRAIRQVPPLEIVCHRVIWSLAFLLVLMSLRGGWRATRAALRSRRNVVTLGATTLLIAGNWLVFIWAVAHDHVLEASLGYFINPLVNVLLGFVFLRERLRRWQLVSVGLAAAGVAYLTLAGGHLPGVALFLAGTFASYGLLRKIAQVDALVGLTVETALLAPLALAYLAYQVARGTISFGHGAPRVDGLLLLAGVVTAIPLLWFTEAARRLRLTTMGFLQYMTPTGHFLLAVLVFGETFRWAQGVAFACIWAALAMYSIEAATRARAGPAVSLPPGME